MAATAILNLFIYAFPTSSIYSKSKFFEIQDGSDRHLEFLKLCISDIIDIIKIEVPMFSQLLVKIGQIVKKWQQFFEIQDDGDGHLEFLKLCISDDSDLIQIEVPMFSQLLVKIDK